MNLEDFIASNPDPRELKRAIAMRMREQGFKHRVIQATLGVSSGYISEWEQRYREFGVEGLRLGHKGSSGYLNNAQRQEIIEWLKQEKQRNLEDLVEYIQENYGITYKSLQSYYELLHQAGMSWHKGVKKVPNKTQQQWQSTIKA